jgi:hypothetical protein
MNRKKEIREKKYCKIVRKKVSVKSTGIKSTGEKVRGKRIPEKIREKNVLEKRMVRSPSILLQCGFVRTHILLFNLKFSVEF